MKKIIYVVNNAAFLVSHRFEICEKALSSGYEVHVAAPYSRDVVEKIKQAGFVFHEVDFSRKGKNPLLEIQTIITLFRLFKKISPSIVHLITIKPYLYGGVAGRLARVPCIISAVAGLGVLFSSNTLKYKILQGLLYPLYKFSFGHKNQKIIFQNTNDRDLLLNWRVVTAKKTVIIRGSGVDLSLCPFHPEPEGEIVVSFAARLLVDKGVKVFADASRILKGKGRKFNFWLIGEPDPGNPNTVTEMCLKEWDKEGLLQLWGYRTDIPTIFARSNIVVLPSYYGEGLPKVLVEAAACGRATITTDHPGCRDAIEKDVTGILIPIKNAKALADAIEDLSDNTDLRKSMGKAGRMLAEHEYAIEIIVDRHMEIYRELLGSSTKV